ncbi:adenylyl-sulfate kinase [Nocardia sp. BMG111209]|uniref:adenylyl-sulfate kinase n=1 Tax=Nocardia sp. BMG111209 TaxID=1160137 RepID=UPI00036B90F0|nr:adenylyl-sulfate kinase [Nocardia sp. BMG111209]
MDHGARPGPENNGGTVLLTGLPSSGKTTLAHAARGLLAERGHAAEVLDGDDVRRRLWPELGLSRADRARNLGRITTVAALLARYGVVVLVAAIAPYADDRARMRAQHAEQGLAFLEVHVATPLPVCRERDVKGLYARRERGELTELTGIDGVYEVPVSPHLLLDTSDETVSGSADRVVALLTACRLVELPTAGR